MFRDGDPGAPLVDIQLLTASGWQRGTGWTYGASIQEFGNPPVEIRGVRVQTRGSRGPDDTWATITGFQLLLANGVCLPGIEPGGDTRDWLLPHDARFAGLILQTGWPQSSTEEGAAHNTHRGPADLVDVQVLHTGWLVCNPNADSYAEVNWVAPDSPTPAGPSGVLLRAQASGGRFYGLVDAGCVQAGQAPGVAFGNQDYTEEALIDTSGHTVVGIRAVEVDHHGITNLSFCFADGTHSRWAFDVAALPTGAKVWSHTAPEGQWAVGLRLRAQDHFGIVDICLRTNNPAALSEVALPTQPTRATELVWELVGAPPNR